jgi:hypothetical protein
MEDIWILEKNLKLQQFNFNKYYYNQGLKLCAVRHTLYIMKLKSVLWFYSLYYDIFF